jgi:hypothetical protein
MGIFFGIGSAIGVWYAIDPHAARPGDPNYFLAVSLLGLLYICLPATPPKEVEKIE